MNKWYIIYKEEHHARLANNSFIASTVHYELPLTKNKNLSQKNCAKNFFLIGENQISDPQIFLLLSKSSEVCLYLSDNKVWHHSGTKNAWAYLVPTSIMQKFASTSLPFLAIQV